MPSSLCSLSSLRHTPPRSSASFGSLAPGFLMPSLMRCGDTLSQSGLDKCTRTQQTHPGGAKGDGGGRANKLPSECTRVRHTHTQPARRPRHREGEGAAIPAQRVHTREAHTHTRQMLTPRAASISRLRHVLLSLSHPYRICLPLSALSPACATHPPAAPLRVGE